MYQVNGFLVLAKELRENKTKNETAENYEALRKKISRALPVRMKDVSFSKNILNNNKIEYVIIVSSGFVGWNSDFGSAEKILSVRGILVEKFETDKKYYKIHI